MNPRIYYLLCNLLDTEELPNIDILKISYNKEDTNVVLQGAKESEQDWSWKEIISVNSVYPLLPLLTNEDFHIKMDTDGEDAQWKLYSYSTKQQVNKIDAILPMCITAISYDYGVEKNIFDEELSSLLRNTFYIS